VLLLSATLAACGGGDSSSSTTTATEATAKGQAEGGSSATASKPAGKSGGSKAGGQSKESSSSEFAPKHHEDSGGGSKQFRVKGGDNSIQEFGGEGNSSEFEAAAAVFHDFLDARADGDWAAACGYMSKRVIESFNEMTSQSNPSKKLGCAKILEVLINPAAKQLMKTEAAKADVGSLRTEGEHGFLLYTTPGSGAQAMPMENEGGTWKVASIAGTPLT
jgi:hypothetical protein